MSHYPQALFPVSPRCNQEGRPSRGLWHRHGSPRDREGGRRHPVSVQEVPEEEARWQVLVAVACGDRGGSDDTVAMVWHLHVNNFIPVWTPGGVAFGGGGLGGKGGGGWGERMQGRCLSIIWHVCEFHNVSYYYYNNYYHYYYLIAVSLNEKKSRVMMICFLSCHICPIIIKSGLCLC